MKSGLCLLLGFGLVLGLIPFIGASQQTPSSGDTNPVPLATIGADANAPVDAAVTPGPSEKQAPTKVKLSIPASELVRLANSGVEQNVLLAYVTNSTSTFNLGAEEIIYLNDIGVPSPVVTAMLQHDQTLKGTMAAMFAANTPTPTPQQMTEPPPQEPPPAEGQPEAPPPAEAPPPETTSDFYGTLAPYGSWVNVDGYGPCWQPTVVVVNPLWQPYCDCGHWVYTDCGWYWSSGYSWGWAPFHYGRWFCHARLGWCWAPDTVWGPSWVCWRHSNAYCGWAPLPPGSAYKAGVGLTFHGHAVQSSDDLGLNNRHYTFVAWNNLHDQHLQALRLPHDQAAHAFNHSEVANRFTMRNNVVVNQGIPATQVASATQAPLHPVALQAASAPSAASSRMDHFDPNNRTLTVYRPAIHESARPAGTVAPSQTPLGFNSGAHPTPTSPTMGQPKPALVQQNPTIISLKGPQSPSTAAGSRQVWNPYTQNPTPWQYNTPGSQPAQTAMNVPQTPGQAQRQVPTYSGQYNQGYQVPNYQAPNYQAPNRSAPVEVPRYNSYPQSHVYSQPGANNVYQGNHQSAQVYQAPPAQQYAAPAQSAAPARSSGNAVPPQQQPSRGDYSAGGGRGR